jgi:hypothetical protein
MRSNQILEDEKLIQKGQQDVNEPVIPDDFFCPLSGQLFLDPVKLPLEPTKQQDGTIVDKSITVERAVVEKWIKDKGKNPFTRKPLKVSDLTPDHEMKNNITAFLDNHKSSPFYENLKEKQYQLQNKQPKNTQAPYVARPTNHRQNQPSSNIHSDYYQAISQRILGLIFDYASAEQEIRFRTRVNRLIRETVSALQSYGLTAELIRRNWQPREATTDWSEIDKDALIYFVTGRPPQSLFVRNTIDALPIEFRLTPLAALREITNLCSDGIRCLMKLYPQGLRGDHLRTWQGSFMLEHDNAIFTLVRTEGINPQEALERIRGLSSDECWDIYRQGHRSSFRV